MSERFRVHRHITTRSGGVSVGPFSSLNLATHVRDDLAAVSRNRKLLARQLNLPGDSIVWMDQTHSTNVAVVDHLPTTIYPDTDALVSTRTDVALAVLTADCVPVLLWDSESGVIAGAHAGRIGARNGIVPKTIEVMISLGANPESIAAFLGPSASGPNYEVPPEMQSDVELHLPGSACETVSGTSGLDLRAGISRQLRERGVTNIEIDPRCSIADKELFSHRRSGATGRFASVIWQSTES